MIVKATDTFEGAGTVVSDPSSDTQSPDTPAGPIPTLPDAKSAALAQALDGHAANGLNLRLQHAYPSRWAMVKLLLKAIWQPASVPQAVTPVVSRQARIVVVGAGTAALSALKALKHHGYQNVQVIAPAGDFGGKCVNLGCMPSEFILHRSEGIAATDADAQASLRADLHAFTSGLSRDVEQQFRGLGYPVIDGRMLQITGKTVHVKPDHKDGGKDEVNNATDIPFDRLILAIGNQTAEPQWPRPDSAPASELMTLDELWTLPAGQKLLITADNNPTAIGLAVVARRLGHQVTIALTGPNPLAALPSYKHYLREVRKAGVTVKDGLRIQQVQAGSVQLESANKSEMLAFDRLLIADRPQPRIPTIDGQQPKLFDFDLVSSSWPQRPDICLIGDAAGQWTASAADAQAQRLIDSWHDHKALDHRVLERLPLRLHGAPGLAMVGPVWTLTASTWHEVDFRALGWSRIHKRDGKLWYCLQPGSDKVAAIHCCHADADNLIAMARILLDHPVTDPRWDAASVHPSSAEIFKLLAEDARLKLQPSQAGTTSKTVETTSHAAPADQQFQAPSLDELDQDDTPAWLGRERRRRALLSQHPDAYVATCLALAKLPGSEPQRAGLVIQFERDGNLKLDGAASVQATHHREQRTVVARQQGSSVTVTY